MKPLLFPLLCLCLITGCTKEPDHTANKGCPLRCSNIPMSLMFSGYFTMEDVDTVIVNEYINDGSFSQVQHDTTYTLSDTGRHYDVPGVALGYATLSAEYDYEIIIPGTGQTFRVWDIVEPNDTMDFCSMGKPETICTTPVREFSLSGGNYTLFHNSHVPVYLVLQK